MLDVASTGEYYSIYHKQAILITDSMTQVELDEAFVPGAQSEEPLEAHTVEALRMWLDTTYKSSLFQLPTVGSAYPSFFHCCTQ